MIFVWIKILRGTQPPKLSRNFNKRGSTPSPPPWALLLLHPCLFWVFTKTSHEWAKIRLAAKFSKNFWLPFSLKSRPCFICFLVFAGIKVITSFFKRRANLIFIFLLNGLSKYGPTYKVWSYDCNSCYEPADSLFVFIFMCCSLAQSSAC